MNKRIISNFVSHVTRVIFDGDFFFYPYSIPQLATEFHFDCYVPSS